MSYINNRIERGENMPDYKQMYRNLMIATEKAINDLIAAQQACEELYILSCEAEEAEKYAEKTEIVKMPTKKP